MGEITVSAASRVIARGSLLVSLCLLLAACAVPAPSPSAPAASATSAPATALPAAAAGTSTPTRQVPPSPTATATPANGVIDTRAATATVAVAVAGTATPVAAGGGGTILYASLSDGCYGEQIYSLDVASGGATRLTSDCDASYRSPSWSPDGERFAVIVSRQDGGGPDIYILSAAGGGAVRVTTDGVEKGTVAWSPDGGRLAYYAYTENAAWDIFVANVDGSGVTRLTSAPYGDTQPAWSADGSRIVFRSERDLYFEVGEVYVMDANGDNQTRLTVNEFDDAWPAFSPDGRAIVFASNRDDAEGTACWHTRRWCNYELYAMDAEGGGERRLTTSDTLELAPVWSPDGSRIAFAAAPAPGSYDLYAIDADGNGLVALTTGNRGGDALSWSPGSGLVLPEATGLPQVMVTPTGRPTAAPSAYPIAPELAEAAAQTYGVPVYYGHSGDVGVNSLGAPLGEAERVPLARQWFGPFDTSVCQARDSLMLWRGDTREIAFLLQGTEGSSEDCYPDYWLAYGDTWQAGDPNNEGDNAPAGYYVPTMGFGEVWRQIRAEQVGAIGYATTEERRTDGLVQRFGNGAAYYFPDSDEVYILFDRFRRVTTGGEVETRAWYRLP